MNQIHSKVFNKEIDQSFDHVISLSRSGVYVLKITASAKSWWQNTIGRRSFFKKDSMAVRVDGSPIVPIEEKKKLRANDFWNGNILKGHELTTYILLVLDKGDHALSFDIHTRPTLWEVVVFPVPDSVLRLERLQTSSRDRIPWITFLIHETVSLSSISVSAKAVISTGKDDDDLQLAIDGAVEKNTNMRAHRGWYWCGKILKGAELTFTRAFEQSQSPRRIDFIADGTPFVSVIVVLFETRSHKRIPSLEEPQWTGDFFDDPVDIILARAIFGEGRCLSELGKKAIGWVIRNRIGYKQWGTTYHDVILHPRHFSAFNKNDRNRIFVEDPSHDPSQLSAWRECYEIAAGIIQGSIADPTKGANHYYSTFIEPPFWTNGAIQTLKVDNTLFYRVTQKAKRAVLPIVLLTFMMIGAGIFASEASRIKPQDFERDSPYFKERIADDSVAVYYGCGTECEGVRVFDKRTGKQKAEFNYGVGYQWSSDKKYVAAFHSSAGHGFTVGNGKGEVLFTYTKPLENTFGIPNFAQWSPSSSTLAVVIQDSETEYELFVVWGFGGAVRIASTRLPPAQTYALGWDETGRMVYVNGNAFLEIDESGYGHHLLEDEGT